MSSEKDKKTNDSSNDKSKEQRDAERTERNKTDPQLTELKGFVDPKEPIEEEGTLNPLTGNRKEPE